MQNFCTNCGAPMVPLLFTRVCSAECDVQPKCSSTVGSWYSVGMCVNHNDAMLALKQGFAICCIHYPEWDSLALGKQYWFDPQNFMWHGESGSGWDQEPFENRAENEKLLNAWDAESEWRIVEPPLSV